MLRAKHWLLRVSLAFASLLVSCSRPPPSPDFISAPGVYTYFDSDLKVEVEETPGGTINYRISRPGVSAGPQTSPIQKTNYWFIHPAAPSSVWVYDGQKELMLIRVDETRATKFTSSTVVPELTNQAPAKVLQRIRANGQRL